MGNEKSWRHRTAEMYLGMRQYELELADRLKKEATDPMERELQRTVGAVFTDAQQHARRMAENVDMVFGDGCHLYLDALARMSGDVDLGKTISRWEKNYGQRYGD